MINLLLIALIVVFIVDISGAIDSFKQLISWIITKGKISTDNYRLKPLDCSLCSTFWSGLIYLLYTGTFSIPYFAFVCLLAYFSEYFKSTILLVGDIFVKIINMIYNRL